MTTTQPTNQATVKLPNTPHINISLGLKHCNQNRPLYFKVLNSFVRRYQNINLNEVEDRKRTLHSLKGISATLGMTSLTNSVTKLEESFEITYVNNFTQELDLVVENIINIQYQMKGC